MSEKSNSFFHRLNNRQTFIEKVPYAKKCPTLSFVGSSIPDVGGSKLNTVIAINTTKAEKSKSGRFSIFNSSFSLFQWLEFLRLTILALVVLASNNQRTDACEYSSRNDLHFASSCDHRHCN